MPYRVKLFTYGYSLLTVLATWGNRKWPSECMHCKNWLVVLSHRVVTLVADRLRRQWLWEILETNCIRQFERHLAQIIALTIMGTPSLVPRPLRPAFVACSPKSGGKAWTDLSHDACRCWHHVQSAHIWVCSLPFTLLFLNSVHSFCSVFPASSIVTGSIMASYSTWRQQQGHSNCISKLPWKYSCLRW